jgi:hypothetical protein
LPDFFLFHLPRWPSVFLWHSTLGVWLWDH